MLDTAVAPMSPRSSTCHLRREVEHALGLHAHLQEVRIRAERGVRAAQLRIQRAAEERLAQVVAGHQREADAGDQQRLRVVAARRDEFGLGVQQLDVGDALPVVLAEPRTAQVREARNEVDGAVVDVGTSARAQPVSCSVNFSVAGSPMGTM